MRERPYVSFAEVKEKVPIPDVLNLLGLADRFTRTNDTLTGICPLPSHAHGLRPNAEQFKINRRDGIWLWHCFGDCQRGGDVLEFVKAMTGYDDAHVRFWFAEHFGDRLTLRRPNRGNKKEALDKDAAREELESAVAPQAASHSPCNLPAKAAPIKPLRFHLNLDPNVPYLAKRGLTAETIRSYGLGLCKKGVLNGYVAIPIHAHPRRAGDNPIAYLGRWPGDDHDETAGRPRYKWPEGFPKSRIVYGLSEALGEATSAPLVVVEGPFKVYHLVQSGVSTAVAIFGSSLSDDQAEILVSTGRAIVLLFDGDEAGQKGMRAAAGKLIRRAFVRVVALPDGQDPDQLSSDELGELLSFVER